VGNNNNEARLFEAASGGQIPEAALEEMNLQFICPAGDAARYRSINGVKAYRYQYFGDWPNLNISYGTGAFHSAEVPMVFGNAALLTGVPNTRNETLVSAYMMGIWTAFAKDPDNALSVAGWPTYEVNGK